MIRATCRRDAVDTAISPRFVRQALGLLPGDYHDETCIVAELADSLRRRIAAWWSRRTRSRHLGQRPRWARDRRRRRSHGLMRSNRVPIEHTYPDQSQPRHVLRRASSSARRRAPGSAQAPCLTMYTLRHSRKPTDPASVSSRRSPSCSWLSAAAEEGQQPQIQELERPRVDGAAAAATPPGRRRAPPRHRRAPADRSRGSGRTRG